MLAQTPENRDLSPADAFEAALDWWREAGVEDDYRDTATSWLAEPEQEQAVASPKAARPPEEPKQTPLQRAFEGASGGGQIGGSGDALPDSLEKFREYWMADETLSHLGPDRRVPPRGVAGAKLMVIVPEPLEGDADGLLSGGPGKFVEAMLRAMGIQPHEAYLASAVPAAMMLPDWNDLAARGLADVTRHQVALAKPHRVLALGRSLAPLFDVSPELAREPAVVKAGEATLPLLLAPELAELARSAPRRKNFWNRWLDWTA